MDEAVSHYKPRSPTFFELFTPKLVTVLREGYGMRSFWGDALAGLTVAIVALPLSMAIAIGSGLSPDKGLFTAIVAGFLISALGGSRFQIGGPAGAFIVLIASVVERHGYEGLVMATLMAGPLMILGGFLRLGSTIKFIPLPVTVAFTAGIAVIIFASQARELFGLSLAHEPAALLPKIAALWDARATFDLSALAVAVLTIVLILALRRYRPAWPGMLIAVAVAATLTAVLHLDIATIGSRFGGVPRTLPAPSLPAFDLSAMRALLPDAFAIALLGSIESLLSAVVADGMTGRRHRSNCELVAQGAANIASVIFGGMCATGTIARTATNVRAGARGPVSGMMHALYILLFMLVAAPLAAYIPLAALAAVLAVVAWNMAEKHEFVALLRASRADAAVLLSTFLLTVLADLTTAIAVGTILGAFLFLHRLAGAIEIDAGTGRQDITGEDRPDTPGRPPYRPDQSLPEGTILYRITGPLFFGDAAIIASVLEQIGVRPKMLILDFSAVPLADSSAAHAMARSVRRFHSEGTVICLTGTRPAVRRMLLHAGLRPPLVRYENTPADAVAAEVQDG